MDHIKLSELLERQRQDTEALNAIEIIVISYARWCGMTDDKQENREAAKTLLDAALDKLEPDDAGKLRDFTNTLGADGTRELIAYVFRHAYDDLIAKTREIERLRDRDTEDDEESGEPAPSRHRRRDRER